VIARPDGNRVTVVAHVSPLLDEAGELVSAVNVLVDISERKRAEEVQALLASIVEKSPATSPSRSRGGWLWLR